jgi:hypothetical protein
MDSFSNLSGRARTPRAWTVHRVVDDTAPDYLSDEEVGAASFDFGRVGWREDRGLHGSSFWVPRVGPVGPNYVTNPVTIFNSTTFGLGIEGTGGAAGKPTTGYWYACTSVGSYVTSGTAGSLFVANTIAGTWNTPSGWQAIDMLQRQLSTPSGIAGLSTTLGEAIRQFVGRLLADRPDLIEEGVSPSLDAFSGLVSFLADHPSVRVPGLTITPEGAVAAIWDHERTARIRLDFIDQTRVQWVVVGSEAKAKSGKGVVDRRDVRHIIEAYHANDWMIA